MSLDTYWVNVGEAADKCESAVTQDQVIDILNEHFDMSSGDAFYGGGGGDRDLLSALEIAGWSVVWIQAYYYWAALPPGEQDRAKGITYVEGDVYRGVQKPI